MSRAPCLAVLVFAPLLPACGLLGIFGDSDSDSATAGDERGEAGGGGENGVTEGDPGGGGGWDEAGGGEGGWPTSTTSTTDIEMTTADNDPEQDMCPCAAGTELIYVLSDVGALWSFDPTTAQFNFIAGIECGGQFDTFSMGVSRKGRAWIQYMNGDLFTVDINDPGDPLHCKDPGFQSGHPLFPNFGMAFVANSIWDPCDKLYAHSGIAPDLIGEDVGALGVIDPQTLELSTIAPIDYAWGELTGTGDGRLFAYQGSSPPLLTEYDKATGAVIDVLPLPGISTDNAFAFAWWGGDFYLFVDESIDFGDSTIYHVDYDESDGDGQAVTKLGSAPLRIVGAGVSTCAPPDPQ